jgi:hypothetical protein
MLQKEITLNTIKELNIRYYLGEPDEFKWLETKEVL